MCVLWERFPVRRDVCVCGAVHRCVICVSAVMEVCLCFRKQDSREHPCMYKQIHLDISKVHQTNISCICIMLIYACWDIQMIGNCVNHAFDIYIHRLNVFDNPPFITFCQWVGHVQIVRQEPDSTMAQPNLICSRAVSLPKVFEHGSRMSWTGTSSLTGTWTQTAFGAKKRQCQPCHPCRCMPPMCQV